MTIVKMIEAEAQKYAEINSETEEEQKRMYEDFRNGAISVYRDLFVMYLHGDLDFMIGKQ